MSEILQSVGGWGLAILAGLLFSGFGAKMVVKMLKKLVPWKKMGDWCEATCAGISKAGNSKLGRVFYEEIEDFFQVQITYLWERCCEGFNKDDFNHKKNRRNKLKKEIVGAALIVIFLAGLSPVIAGTPVVHTKPFKDTESPKVLLDLGFTKFRIPFRNVNQVNMFDIMKGEGLIGAETPVVDFWHVTTVFGGVVSIGGEGMPYIGGHIFTPEKYFGQRIAVGLWIGRDFRDDENRGGVKASIPLW